MKSTEYAAYCRVVEAALGLKCTLDVRLQRFDNPRAGLDPLMSLLPEDRERIIARLEARTFTHIKKMGWAIKERSVVTTYVNTHYHVAWDGFQFNFIQGASLQHAETRYL